MAQISRRRSRAVESDDGSDDEEPSRQGTPASTAPFDSKRARFSQAPSTSDDDNDEPSSKEQANRIPPLMPRDESKPVIINGVRSTKPKHQPGAILRVKLTNFVTYTSAEFFPGPNLNMVIGPNGTGKSTLVCAICLGLGWGTQYLGRAKDAAEFVKHGCQEATIEIELQRALNGPNMSRSNPVICRTIKKKDNKSSYTLNGRNASAKAVMELARSYDIQIDNLCQFLPQDKVVEFAQMTPVEILKSTQQAAAAPQMLEKHERLKELRVIQTESNNQHKMDREALANFENRQEMQRTEVERLKERAAAQKRLNWLQRCRPIPLFAEAKTRRSEAKSKQKAVAAELKHLMEESGPSLRKFNAKQVYEKEVKKHKEQQEKAIRNVERECDRLARSAVTHETTIEDCKQIEAAEKKSLQPFRADISRSRTKIATLRKQKEQTPEPFDSRRMNQEIQEHVTETREIESRLEELHGLGLQLKSQIAARNARGREVNQSITALDTIAGQQEDLLKKKSKDAFEAWVWIKGNRDRFQKEVFGPPMVECTLKDPSVASQIESLLQQNDFRIFTVQCKEDFQLLQKELTQSQRLHDISIRTCPIDSIEGFRSPLSSDQMQQFGLKGWAIDYLQGPNSVLAMLCQEKFLHQCALTNTDITQAQHDQLSVIPAVKGYVSKAKSYQFIRRAEYGAAGISAREKATRVAEIWTDQPVDSSRKLQLEAERRECQNDIKEIRLQLPVLGAEHEQLTERLKRVTADHERLKKEKDEKQKALVEYNGLDAKIAQEEEKIVRWQNNIEMVGQRLTDNAQKRDEAMFAKTDVVLEYCGMVHSLQESIKALIEVEVAHIEAQNDCEVLRLRNEDIVQLLSQKRTEEADASMMAVSEGQKARALLEELKKLRDEGLELTEQENDRGLTNMLEELTAMPDLTVGDVEDMIKVEEARVELSEGGDVNTLREFEDRAKKIERLRRQLGKMDAKQQEVLHEIHDVREQWERPLDELVAKISDAFGDSFARIGCAGQVVVHKASSSDPVDCTEELGGSDNGLDFANWAIHISVKFRENESLSLLDSHRQSGGERAVSTIFYLMALQSLSRAPFRVVDEINQGMDPRNERMVHGRMVDLAATTDDGEGTGSQYFLITPKLLSGLKYRTGMTVLCIVSGENMPSAADTREQDEMGKWISKSGKKIDFAEFVRIARRLGGGSSNIDNSNRLSGAPWQQQHLPDQPQTRGRHSTSVGA